MDYAEAVLVDAAISTDVDCEVTVSQICVRTGTEAKIYPKIAAAGFRSGFSKKRTV